MNSNLPAWTGALAVPRRFWIHGTPKDFDTRLPVYAIGSAFPMGEHDRIFKRAFRLPEHAKGELLAVLPERVLEIVDLDSLALIESDDLVDRWLDERFRDALFSASFRGVSGYIWFLVEHQSEPDRFMALRVLEYLVRSWIELLRLEPKRKNLPPVVSVIVHHGEHGWNAPTRLRELIEGLDRLPELAGLVPDFEILVDDLVKQPDEELKRRPLPLFPKIVLWVLRDARVIQRFYDRLIAWSEELAQLSKEAPEDAATVMRYILSVAGDEPFENLQKRIIEVVPAMEKAMATPAEQLIQEGIRRGEARGRAEGKAEALLAILEERGLTMSPEQRARILESKDVSELDRWLRKAVSAQSVAELFSHSA